MLAASFGCKFVNAVAYSVLDKLIDVMTMAASMATTAPTSIIFWLLPNCFQYWIPLSRYRSSVSFTFSPRLGICCA
jgi:hypothetical protein